MKSKIEAISTLVSTDAIHLSTCREMVEKYLHDPEQLVPIIRDIHDDKQLEVLFQIILDCRLNPKEVLANCAIFIATENYNHDSYPGLFIKHVLSLLKSKLTNPEFRHFLAHFAGSINPVLYANEEYAFEEIRNELLELWTTDNPRKLIDAIKISLQLKKEVHSTPISDLLSHIKEQYFNDLLINALVEQLEPLEFISVFSACSNAVQNKLCVKLFAECDLEQAMKQIRLFNELYPRAAFPTSFRESLIKQLKIVNGDLLQQIKTNQLFGLNDQSDFDRDLQSLQEILEHTNLTHDQRRTEIGHLRALIRAFRESENTCPIIIKMFNAIPCAYWPYLFIYYDAPIIHWSFPHERSHLELLKRTPLDLPPDRTNTWLNNLDIWKDILVKTLISISTMEGHERSMDFSRAWALGHVQEALTKTEQHIEGFANKVLKEFFLADVGSAKIILNQMTNDSRGKYDIYRKFIVDDALIASWLPDDSDARVALLSSAFTAKILGRSDRIKAGTYLDKPYVRNQEDQLKLILHIINNRDMHIINFLDAFTLDGLKTIIQGLYKIDPSGTERLLIQAMNDIMSSGSDGTNSPIWFITLLLCSINYTNIDVFSYIEQIENKQLLVAKLCDLDIWKAHTQLSKGFLHKINAHYDPQHYYEKVTQFLELNSEGYFASYEFVETCSVANKIAIAPYQSYLDYLNSNAAEKDKIVRLITNNIKEFINSSCDVPLKQASYVFPEIVDSILTKIATEIKSVASLSDVDEDAQDKINSCLNNLVRIYGVEIISEKCRTFGLATQAGYLDDKFKYYPQLLNQQYVLSKWFKIFLNPNYIATEKISPMEWEKIHKINEITGAVLLKHSASAEPADGLEINADSAIFAEICASAKIDKRELVEALPTSYNRIDIKLCKNGEVYINSILTCDCEGTYLSKAGMKFVSKYLSAEDCPRDILLAEFAKLDKRSQDLLQERVMRSPTHPVVVNPIFATTTTAPRPYSYVPGHFKPKWQSKIDAVEAARSMPCCLERTSAH